jgi:diguanylate cyclase (GGDEF)-like protein
MAAGEELTITELVSCLELGKALTSELEHRGLLQTIMDKVSALMPADNWSLLTLDDDGKHLRFAVTVGLDFAQVRGLALEAGRGVVGRAVAELRPQLVPDVAADGCFDPQVDRLTGFTTRSLLCAPLVFAGKPLGAIEAVNPRRLDPAALKLLTTMADFAAIAVENARRYQHIRHLAAHDGLTGLYNTRYLYHSLAELKGRGQPFSLVFLDMDNFKRLVDAQGHLLGSQALAEVAATIGECLEPPAYAVAYGGDEFVVVLPGGDKTQALELAERIRRRMAATAYLAQGGEETRLTASFGVAACPGDAGDVKAVLALADQAMFRVKGRGKNAVE